MNSYAVFVDEFRAKLAEERCRPMPEIPKKKKKRREDVLSIEDFPLVEETPDGYVPMGEYASKHGVTGQSVRYHIVSGRIEGVVRIEAQSGHGNHAYVYRIPADAPYPADRSGRRQRLGSAA